MKISKKNLNTLVKIFFLLSYSIECLSQNQLNLSLFSKNHIISSFEINSSSKPKENLNESSIKMNIQNSSTKYLQNKKYEIKIDKVYAIIESRTTRIKTETDNGMIKSTYDSDNVFERDASATLLANRYDPLINKPLKVRYV